jgi:ketosteroid isomerase-like protein
MATPNCTINSYSWSDEQMNMIGNDVAVLTFRADQDYTCDGKKGPTPTWSASVYVREGDKWRNQFYLENPVVDPKAPPPPAKKGETAAAPSTPDALTEALMAVEKAAWEAWKVRDAKGVEGAMAKDFMYVSGTGRRDRAASLKNWSEPKCEGLGYTFLEPKSVQLSPDVALVTYKANATGKCDGVAITPTMWVASYSVKQDGVWKNAFYTDIAR